VLKSSSSRFLRVTRPVTPARGTCDYNFWDFIAVAMPSSRFELAWWREKSCRYSEYSSYLVWALGIWNKCEVEWVVAWAAYTNLESKG
jgi:hypothetical protein